MKREKLLCDSLSKERQIRIQDLERQQTDLTERSGQREKLSKQQTELERLQIEGFKRLEDLITKELMKLNNHQTELESQQAEGLKRLEDLIIKEQKECEKLSKEHIKEIEQYFKQYCFLIIAVIVICTAVLIYNMSH